MVVLVPQDKERRAQSVYYRSAATDESGRFRFQSVVPGDYAVFAWEDLEEGDAYMDPEFLKPFESKGLAVTIREGEKQEIQVTAIPGDAPAPKA
jgi:uncharacterized protein (DUF2141 family)